MAHLLESKNIAAFLQRFGDFHDAIVRSINITFRSRERISNQVDIVLSAIDLAALDTDNDWVNIHFVLTEVSDFAFVEENISYQVVFELAIKENNGWLTFDFDESSGPSKFYIKGRRCEWDVLPYTEV